MPKRFPVLAASLFWAACAAVPRVPAPVPEPMAGWWKFASPRDDEERRLAWRFTGDELIVRMGRCGIGVPAVLYSSDGRVWKISMWRTSEGREDVTFSREPDDTLVSVDSRGTKDVFTSVSRENAAAIEQDLARSPPAGWWIVRSGEGTGMGGDHAVGSGWRFRLGELDTVSSDRQPRRIDYSCFLGTDGGGWKRGRFLPGEQESDETLARRADGTLLYSFEKGKMVLARASAAEAAAFDQAFQGELEITLLCPRAERCCVRGMEILGGACDVDAELGNGEPESCRRLPARIRERLEGAKKPVPAECR